MHKTLKIIIKTIFIVLLCLIVTVGAYVGYVVFSYSRIPDKVDLSVHNGGKAEDVKTGTEYTVITQNVGFGAYTQDYTFFLDGGKESWARSPESVKNCLKKAYEKISSFSPDFILLQEVDTDSTRTYHIDEKKYFDECFTAYSDCLAMNYHSSFLFWPLYQPHGASNSAIVTYSAYNMTSSLRRSLPISTSLSKFLDLDRCYSVSRIPAENGKEMVLYNVHTSAYGNDESIRTEQLTMLFEDMRAEYEKGNYCVCGGDFNHDFTGDSSAKLNGEQSDFGWAAPFPIELLSKYSGLTRADNYTCGECLPTCRNNDVPYKKGNFTVIVDGFIFSDNVSVTYLENVQTDFEYSDHNPVLMKFKLG